MRNVVLMCYRVVRHLPEVAECSSAQQRKRQCLQLFQRVQLTLRGEIATCYVLSLVFLWLAFLEVNHGENCSQSCLEDTRSGTGSLELVP